MDSTDWIAKSKRSEKESTSHNSNIISWLFLSPGGHDLCCCCICVDHASAMTESWLLKKIWYRDSMKQPVKSTKNVNHLKEVVFLLLSSRAQLDVSKENKVYKDLWLILFWWFNSMIRRHHFKCLSIRVAFRSFEKDLKELCSTINL